MLGGGLRRTGRVARTRSALLILAAIFIAAVGCQLIAATLSRGALLDPRTAGRSYEVEPVAVVIGGVSRLAYIQRERWFDLIQTDPFGNAGGDHPRVASAVPRKMMDKFAAKLPQIDPLSPGNPGRSAVVCRAGLPFRYFGTIDGESFINWTRIFANGVVLVGVSAIILLLHAGWRGIVRANRVRSGRCPDCGYPLSPVRGCSECGWGKASVSGDATCPAVVGSPPAA
jgi:hypothetical protein